MARKTAERQGRGRPDEAIYLPKDPTIAAFVTELHYAGGRGARTCEAYARDLEFFAAFLRRDLMTAQRSDVKAFVLDLAAKRRYQPAAIRRKLVALRRFYRYLAVEGRREDDPTVGVDSPKLPKHLPSVLDEDAVARLLRGLLFGVTADDPVTFLGMLAALTVVAAIAGYIPALRASRIDPAVALRAN